MKRVVGTLVALGLATGGVLSCTKSFDATKFDSVVRKYRAVTEATRTGVSLIGLQPKVGEFETEVAVLGDKPMTEKESTIYSKFKTASERYRDSVTLWKYAISEGWTPGSYIRLFAAGEPTDEITMLVQRNALSVIKNDDGSQDLRPEAIQDLWDAGREAGESAATELKIQSGP